MINENTPLLQTERLILRKFTPNDITPLFELLSDEDVNTFLPCQNTGRNSRIFTAAIPVLL